MVADRDDWEAEDAKVFDDDLDFQPVIPRKPKRPSRRLWLILGLVLVPALAVAGGVGWYVFEGKLPFGLGKGDGGGAVPFIRADTTPFKTRPSQEGGRAIPDRDKLVYDRIQGDGPTPRVERLLPPAEKPLPGPQPAANKLATSRVPTTQEVNAATKPPPAPVSPPEGPPKGPLAGPKPSAPATPAVVPKPQAKPAPEPKTTVGQSKAAGRFRIQVASVKDKAAAEREWRRLQAANKDLLGALRLEIERADLGKRGIYHRLQAGPLADEASAKGLCAALTKRKIGCLIVRPKP